MGVALGAKNFFREKSKNVIVLNFKGKIGGDVGAFVGFGGQYTVTFSSLIHKGVCLNWIRKVD